MRFIRAEHNQLEPAYRIIQASIEAAYSPCYPREVVDFFRNVIHTRENISRDIDAGALWLMEEDGECFGTGCLRGDEIARVYLLPDYQGRGYGGRMMDFLEKSAVTDTVQLSPSLPAEGFYRNRGYRLLSHEDCPLGNGVVLSRDIMEKHLR